MSTLYKDPEGENIFTSVKPTSVVGSGLNLQQVKSSSNTSQEQEAEIATLRKRVTELEVTLAQLQEVRSWTEICWVKIHFLYHRMRLHKWIQQGYRGIISLITCITEPAVRAPLCAPPPLLCVSVLILRVWVVQVTLCVIFWCLARAL